MRRTVKISAALCAGLLALDGFGQDKTRPDQLVKDAFKKFRDSQGHVRQRVESAYITDELEGAYKQNFCAMKGTGFITDTMPMKNTYGKRNDLEFYSMKDKVLVTIKNPQFKNGYVDPTAIGKADGVLTSSIHPPYVLLEEAEWGLSLCKQLEDEKVKETDCYVVYCPIKDEQKKVQSLVRLVGSHGDGKTYATPSNANLVLDLKTTVLEYKVWIGKEDGRLRKIEKTLKVELKPEIKQLSSMLSKNKGDSPTFDLFTGTCFLEVLKYDDHPEMILPPPVKQKFGLREDLKPPKKPEAQPPPADKKEVPETQAPKEVVPEHGLYCKVFDKIAAGTDEDGARADLERLARKTDMTGHEQQHLVEVVAKALKPDNRREVLLALAKNKSLQREGRIALEEAAMDLPAPHKSELQKALDANPPPKK